MLNDLWLLLAGLLVLIGLVASQSLLLVVGSLVIIIWLATKVWDRHAFSKVSHHRALARHRAFIGDTLEYSVTLSNDKVLPLIWVDIQDAFPEGLELLGANVRSQSIDGTRQHTITTSLLPFQQVTWKYVLHCTKRGYHRIGPVRVRSGDIFGFGAAEVNYDETEHLLVYPRVVDLEQLNLPAEHPLGSGRGKRPLFQDTTRFIGQRDYLPTDPMKHIDWKATARTARLQTKVYEPVISLNVLVALNANTGEQPWETINRRLFERSVTIAASVANHAAERGYTFGVLSNAVATYTSRYLSVPLSASADQLNLVFDALSMAAPYAVTTLPEVLRGERASLPPGATVAVITAVLTQVLAREIAELKGRGYQVLVLYTGEDAPLLDLPDVSVVSVGAAADVVEAHEPVFAE